MLILASNHGRTVLGVENPQPSVRRGVSVVVMSLNRIGRAADPFRPIRIAAGRWTRPLVRRVRARGLVSYVVLRMIRTFINKCTSHTDWPDLINGRVCQCSLLPQLNATKLVVSHTTFIFSLFTNSIVWIHNMLRRTLAMNTCFLFYEGTHQKKDQLDFIVSQLYLC